MSDKLWSVRRKADGVEVYRYWSEAPVNWAGYELATHDHVDTAPAPEPPARPPSVYSGRRVLTKREFLMLFTQQERIALRQLSKGNSDTAKMIDDYMFLLDQAQDVTLDHADTIAGLQMLEAGGLLAAGRAAEILNG